MPLYAAIDVGFPDDPKVVDAGDIAELVYLRCVLRARGSLTDGVIDRRVLSRWLVGIRGPHGKHMDRLVEVGLLCTHDAGWCIPLNAWKKWNPTKAEVEQKREDEKQRKADYRDKKRAEEMSQRDNGGTPNGIREVSAHVKPEPTEKPTEKPASSGQDDPTMAEAKRRVDVLKMCGKVIGSEPDYLASIYERLHRERWKPEQDAQPCTDPDCDQGFIDQDDGSVAACPNCNPWLVDA